MKTICLTAVLTIMFAVVVCIVRAQKPELVVQTGSFNTVLCGAFTPDGKVFASGDADGKVILWDVATGKQFQIINAGGSISSLVFREAGKSLVTAQSHYISGTDYKSEISVWETASGKRLSSFTPSAEREDVVLSSDGLLAASRGGFDEMIKLWDIATGKQLKTFGEAASDPFNAALISAFAFSPDGTALAVVSHKDIKLWNTKTGALKRTFKTASDLLEVNDLIALSPDGKYFARTAPNDAVGIRNAATGAQAKILRGKGKLKTLAFTPDSAQLITVHEIQNDSGTTEEREIRLWNVLTGKEILTIKPAGSEEIEKVVVSPDGTLLAAVGGSIIGGQVLLFDTATGEEISRLEGQTERVGNAFLTRQNYLVAAYGYGNSAKIWSLSDGREKQTFEARNIALSSDEKLLAVYSDKFFDHKLQVFDYEKKSLLYEIKQNRQYNTDFPLVFSPDGKFLARGGAVPFSFTDQRFEGDLTVWEAKTGKQLYKLADTAGAVAFSPDSAFLAGCAPSDDKKSYALKIWKTSDGAPVLEIKPAGIIGAVAFSADGKSVYVSTFQIPSLKDADNTIRGRVVIYDAASGREIAKTADYAGFSKQIALNSDGKLLFAGEQLGNLKIFDAVTGIEKQTLSGHEREISAISFSADGKTLVTSGADGQIIFRDAASLAEKLRWIMTGNDNFVAVTPEGYYFSSREAAPQALAFRFGRQTFPFDQFDLTYNRPDIVLERLGAASPETLKTFHAAYLRRLSRAGLTPPEVDTAPALPEVSVRSGNIPKITASKQIAFRVQASDARYALKNFNVFVNETPLYGAGGVQIKDKEFEQDVKIELSNGVNRIQLVAQNEKGFAGTQTFIVRYNGAPAKPKLYILAVGVSEYSESAYNLRYAAKDAADLVKLFEERAAQPERVLDLLSGKVSDAEKSFYEVRALKLTNANATREKITSARDFLRQATVDDEVLVFFAGHGLLDKDGNYFFGTTDIDFKNPGARGLSYEALENLLDGVRSRRKLLLIDTCHAGETDDLATNDAQTPAAPEVKPRELPRAEIIGKPKKLSESFIALQEMFNDLRRGTGTTVISAAGGQEYAYEGAQWNNGVFTYTILTGLTGGQADTDRNNQYSVAELRRFVSEKVKTLTGGRQNPMARRESPGNNFRVF